MKDPLSTTHSELAAQWHSAKNGELTPDDVVAGSHKKVWWKCPNSSDHEWDAPIKNRVKLGRGCPYCVNQKVSVTNSLASLYSEIAAQWHPIKNGRLTPNQVIARSDKKAWWKCPNGSDHEWDATIGSRVRGIGCPYCAGKKVSITNSLIYINPKIAKEWHPLKNGTLTPDQVVAGSAKQVWWLCAKNPLHEWQASIEKRVRSGRGCPYCVGKAVCVTNSLASLCPYITKEWHPSKNGTLTPDKVVLGSKKKVWWKCPNSSDHEWQASIGNRVKGTKCPFCAGQKPSVTNSLANLYPEIAAQWHPTKNGTLTPEKIVAGSEKKAWWRCKINPIHEWEAIISSRVRGSGCACCAGYKVSVTNSLTSLYPEIAQDWHHEKNGAMTPDQVVAGSTKKAWWRCKINPSHEWEASIVRRTKRGTGCPICNSGWTVQNIRTFVASLINHLETFTPAELYLLFQQSGLLQTQGKSKGSGLLQTQGKSKGFVKALTTGRFPKEELEKFVDGEPSVVDNFLQDKQLTLETLETNSNNNIPDRDTTTSDDIDATVEALEKQEDLNLPLVQTREVLASLNHHVVSSADEEAVEFIIASAKAKIWKHTFIDETAALAQAKAYTGDSYAEKVKSEFLEEYHRAKNLPIPSGYNFHAPPNLMQRLAAVQLQDKKRVGNWSGTGAGKTLSAILASRVINAYLTVICCPNSVVDGWEKAIINIFPDSKVAKKTFTPDWTKLNSCVLFANRDFEGKVNRYLILNYEMFQQPHSANRVRSLLENEQIDFIVIDEIHYTKQRQVEVISRPKIIIPLPDNPIEVQQRQRRYGDFSSMNHYWNQSRSETTHQRLKENPEEWMQYHTLYREARKSWAVIPYEEMIRWCQQRNSYTIGDFGCGEAKLASAVCNKHTVYSFDHIAINENVIPCNIAHVPLDDETLDMAIFSLSLMGSNFTDYLQEAHRTLKLDGTLHIIEATSRFSDIDKFRNDLEALGFEVMEPKQMWKFTHIRAIKSELKPQMQVELRL